MSASLQHGIASSNNPSLVKHSLLASTRWEPMNPAAP